MAPTAVVVCPSGLDKRAACLDRKNEQESGIRISTLQLQRMQASHDCGRDLDTGNACPVSAVPLHRSRDLLRAQFSKPHVNTETAMILWHFNLCFLILFYLLCRTC